MSTLARPASLLLVAAAIHTAHASPVAFRPNASFATGAYTLDLGAAGYMFTNSGDFFNPVTVATTGTGTVAAFGGFLGTPLAPTSYFTDPGRAPFIDGNGYNYQPFPAGGIVQYSVSPAYLALAFTLADGLHYGYAYTNGARLVRYGYESVAGVGIQAPPVSTPEPAAFALFGLGLYGLTIVRRRHAI